LAHKGDTEAFGRTLESITRSVDFDRTLLLLVFEKKLYELEEYLFAVTDELLARNARAVCGAAEADSLLSVAEEHGCEIVAFLNEGDSLDSHFLEYAGYFFDEAGGFCGAVAAPVFESESEKALPPLFADAPPGGIKALDAETDLPLCASGAALLISALDDAGFPKGLPADEAFLYAFLKTVLREGRIGLLPALALRGGGSARTRVSRVLEKLAEDLANEGGFLPPVLTRSIESYAEAQLRLPPEEADADVSRLLGYAPDFAERIRESLDASPHAEIESVENNYADVSVTGELVCAADGSRPRVRVPVPAELISFETRPAEDCFADRVFPRVRFTTVLRPDENGVAELRFFSGRRGVTDIRVPERTERSEPFRNYAVAAKKNALSIERLAPRAYYKLSCILPVFNGEAHLEEAIESVLAQSLEFFENIQLVIVNDGSTDGTERICLKYKEKYPYNVDYAAHARNLGVGAARNSGLRLAMGEYIAFLDADDRLDSAMFEKGVRVLKDAGGEADIAVFPLRYFGGGADDLRSSPVTSDDETTAVDLEEEPRRVLFSACAAVMRESALADIRFDERLRFSEDAEFMHAVLLKKMKYIAVKEPAYMYRTEADGGSAMRGRTQNPAWYEKNSVFGEAITSYSERTHGRVTQYTRHLIVHELLGGLTTETPEDPPPREAVRGALAGVAASLRVADEESITDAKTPPPWFKHFLLQLKRGETRLEYDVDIPVFRADGDAIDPQSAEIRISALRERRGVLRVYGLFGRPPGSGVVPVALGGERDFAAKLASLARREIFFFCCPVYEEFAFSFEIPINDILSGGGLLSFALRTNASDLPAKLRFEKNAGPDEGQESFFAGETILLTRADDGPAFCAEPISDKRLAEIVPVRLDVLCGGKAAEAKRLFEEYLRMRPLFAKSRIWLFSDGVQKAGSNSEHLFVHCAKLRDGIDKYFVIGKDTLDGWRLSETGSVLEYGSDMHKLLCLFAEKFIVSETLDDGTMSIEPAGLREVFDGLWNGKTILLPRDALTKETAPKLKDIAASAGLLFVASESERNLAVRIGGMDEDAVYATGSPSFDLLADKNGRRILFMPAHRESLYKGEGLHNPNFENSEYCAAINELLCDERLFDAAEEYGYAFDFAPHEKTRLQMADFEMDEIVNIIPPGRDGKALLEEASLLVTDCMPAQAAAYMKKPVVYYNFAEDEGLPFGCRFEDEESFPGGARFGRVFSTPGELTDALIAHMREDCAVSEEYARKPDAYFAHTDGKSRERIYRILLELEG
jgi:glycosyltransferase involved in cell wall biosynthesis